MKITNKEKKDRYLNKDKNRWDLIFPSVQALIEYGEDCYVDNEGVISGNTSKKWLGVEGRDAVKKAVVEGWPEGVKELLEIKKDLHLDIPPVQSIRRRRIKGDHGDYVDMQAVYSGNLDRAWTRTAKRQVNGGAPIITIQANIGENCGVNSKKMFYKGAIAVILTDLLEEAGYRVEIKAWSYAKGVYRHGAKNAYTETLIKHFEEPLDINRVAGTLALAGFLREFYFKAWVATPQEAGWGLGSSQKTLPKEFVSSKNIVLSSLPETREDVITLIKKELDKIIK